MTAQRQPGKPPVETMERGWAGVAFCHGADGPWRGVPVSRFLRSASCVSAGASWCTCRRDVATRSVRPLQHKGAGHSFVLHSRSCGESHTFRRWSETILRRRHIEPQPRRQSRRQGSLGWDQRPVASPAEASLPTPRLFARTQVGHLVAAHVFRHVWLRLDWLGPAGSRLGQTADEPPTAV